MSHLSQRRKSPNTDGCNKLRYWVTAVNFQGQTKRGTNPYRKEGSKLIDKTGCFVFAISSAKAAQQADLKLFKDLGYSGPVDVQTYTDEIFHGRFVLVDNQRQRA